MDIEAIISCSFDFDLEKKKKKIRNTRPISKKVVDNQTIILVGLSDAQSIIESA